MQLPLNLELRPDGKVDLQGATLTLDDLKVKLEEISVVTPGQSLVIKGSEKVAPAQVKKVITICRAAKLVKVTVAKAGSAPGSLVLASNTAGEASAKPKSAKTYASSPNVPIATGPNDTVP